MDTTTALGDGAGFGVGLVVAVGAGDRDEARGDMGCAAPAGTLEAAAVDRRTAQVTRPQ